MSAGWVEALLILRRPRHAARAEHPVILEHAQRGFAELIAGHLPTGNGGLPMEERRENVA